WLNRIAVKRCHRAYWLLFLGPLPRRKSKQSSQLKCREMTCESRRKSAAPSGAVNFDVELAMLAALSLKDHDRWLRFVLGSPKGRPSHEPLAMAATNNPG